MPSLMAEICVRWEALGVCLPPPLNIFLCHQIMEIREVFDTFDSDGSGSIDIDELRAAMKVRLSRRQLVALAPPDRPCLTPASLRSSGTRAAAHQGTSQGSHR